MGLARMSARSLAALALLLSALVLGGCEGFFLKPLVADFSASPKAGLAPLLVQFEDRSSYAPQKPITTWRWDFGDGTESTDPQPGHTYTEPGEYRVSLTVKDEAGRTDSMTRTGYIEVRPEDDEEYPPVALPPTKGSPEAPVTMVQFSDFTCPYCAQFALRTLPKIEKNYIATGKVELVFRNFPVHGDRAVRAAEAALCAHEQGAFWEYHDRLFANSLTGSREIFSVEDLKTLAADLRLDTERFDQCLASQKYSQAVGDDRALGKRLRVRGTPTLFINDRKVVGAQPYETFRRVIEEELAKGG